MSRPWNRYSLLALAPVTFTDVSSGLTYTAGTATISGVPSGATVVAGSEFQLTDGNNTPESFYFEPVGTANPPVNSILYNPGTSQNAMATLIVNAINAAGFNITASQFGNTVVLGNSLSGETFSLTDNTNNTVAFTFWNGVGFRPQNAVEYRTNYTANQMAQAIATAIDKSGLAISGGTVNGSSAMVTLTGLSVLFTNNTSGVTFSENGGRSRFPAHRFQLCAGQWTSVQVYNPTTVANSPALVQVIGHTIQYDDATDTYDGVLPASNSLPGRC